MEELEMHGDSDHERGAGASAAAPEVPAGPDVQRISILPVRNGSVVIGGGTAHHSHMIRFVGQYVWCEVCGAFASGKESRLLARACRRHCTGREEAIRNLARGRKPRSHSAEAAAGAGHIRIVGDIAEQVFV